jgi:hypothetical protein
LGAIKINTDGMKKTILYLLIIGVTACAPVSYFQVFKTDSNNLNKQKDALVFENDQCKILYNLWGSKGNVGFIFFNKTETTIILNKAECFFIINGISYDYFQNRVYTKSSSIGVSSNKGGAYTKSSSTQSSSTIQYAKSETNLLNAFSTGILTSETSGSSNSYSDNTSNTESYFISQGVSISKGHSVSYNESPTILIPPKSAKVISEFNILSSRFISCDLISHPAKEIKSLTFTKSNSPYIFSNRICYSIDSLNSKPIFITNTFFVTEISNMPHDNFYYDDYEYICGNKSYFKVKFKKFASPENFYLEY